MTTNLLGPADTLLPEEPDVLASIANTGLDAADVVVAHPASPLAWALLSNNAYNAEKMIESYAFARVGYHRGLDALRKGGWKGHGPVPWSHAPNRGVLRAFYALQRAADAIGEEDEVERLGALLTDSDPTAAAAIEAEHPGH
ncbi:DUF3151 domain-containing protein [Marisediminicola antarctica]|uniref:DUF3151 domain-containing protein n=1 Tax=Marisediminicola antarctica TaxID=674079 RepID=A0A7L5AKA8_9MICO|nr:DUF3151 domain-containing protein [Marisediminicola antarctica]QHO68739.1 hypothetical protein BHD05_02885 [Marisediminicola antarctica]